MGYGSSRNSRASEVVIGKEQNMNVNHREVRSPLWFINRKKPLTSF